MFGFNRKSKSVSPVSKALSDRNSDRAKIKIQALKDLYNGYSNSQRQRVYGFWVQEGLIEDGDELPESIS